MFNLPAAKDIVNSSCIVLSGATDTKQGGSQQCKAKSATEPSGNNRALE